MNVRAGGWEERGDEGRVGGLVWVRVEEEEVGWEVVGGGLGWKEKERRHEFFLGRRFEEEPRTKRGEKEKNDGRRTTRKTHPSSYPSFNNPGMNLTMTSFLY